MLNSATKTADTSEQLSCSKIETNTEEPTLLHLIDKVGDLAIANQDAGLILAGALSISVIFWAIADAAAKLLKAVRSQ
ncbi:MAG: hypothetical protein F6K14_18415 [Symploca sp. SIO2C1]|nr:hypothetical protein [Symploca sp. SIO2C1]